MQILRIPKGNGRFRTVYSPPKEEKEEMRRCLPALTAIAMELCPPNVVHGFMPGRSPLTNALQHVGYDYTLSMDLEDFFDTVTARHVSQTIPADIFAIVMRYGAARQGLPSSPMVANIAAAPMDWEILRKLPSGAIYTRYADDLCVSFRERGLFPQIAVDIGEVAQRRGFNINGRKTKLQSARGGRRVITGVAVDDKRAYPTRAVRRKLRAAKHHGNPGSTAGLTEWCKLKMPALYRTELDRQRKLINQQIYALAHISEDAASAAAYGKAHRSLDFD